MEPTTLVAIGVGLYFLLSGAGKKDEIKEPEFGPCPEGSTRNKEGICVAEGTEINCAPGLVRGPDGKCQKKVKAKPGTKVDPSEISKTRPDVIDVDDAWIGPGCNEIAYGPDFFRGTIVPAAIEYTDAGYGFDPGFYVEGEPIDMGAVASIGSVAVIAGMLETYSPTCAELLLAFDADALPSQAQMDAYNAKVNAAREAYVASLGAEFPNGDPELSKQLDAVRAENPLAAYSKAQKDFFANFLSSSLEIAELATAIELVIEARGYQNLAAREGYQWVFDPSPYPARFTPAAEDFAA